MVRCALGSAPLCNRSDRKAARAASVNLPLRALDARRVGIRRVSDFLLFVDGDVLDRRFLPEPVTQTARAG